MQSNEFRVHGTSQIRQASEVHVCICSMGNKVDTFFNLMPNLKNENDLVN